MLKKTLVVLAVWAAAILFILILSSQVHAQAACGDRDAIVKALNDKHEEFIGGIGIAEEGSVIELYVDYKTGTWTLIHTTTTGITCLLSHGHSWEQIQLVKGQEI